VEGLCSLHNLHGNRIIPHFIDLVSGNSFIDLKILNLLLFFFLWVFACVGGDGGGVVVIQLTTCDQYILK
jgi:hypothetical protein